MSAPAWPWLAAGAGVALAGGAAAYRLVTGWQRGQPLSLKLFPIGGGFELEEQAAKAFLEMKRAAGLEGVTLVVNSAFRTMEEQQRLYSGYVRGELKNVAAEPGYSNHQAARAVDVDTDLGTNEAFAWLTANAARFGFRRTVSSEPHHWEYV